MSCSSSQTFSTMQGISTGSAGRHGTVGTNSSSSSSSSSTINSISGSRPSSMLSSRRSLTCSSVRPVLSCPAATPTVQAWQQRWRCVVAAAAAAPRPSSAPAAPDTSATTSSSSSSNSDWRALLISKAVQPGQLVRLTLKAKIKGDAGLANIKPAAGSSPPPPPAAAAAAGAGTLSGSGVAGSSADQGSMPYKQLTLRPVLIKGKVMLQLSLLTARQDITKNFSESQAAGELAQLLLLPWSSGTLTTASEVVTVQVSRKGKALVQVKPSTPQQQQQQQQREEEDGAASELFASQPQQQQQQQQVLISLQHDRVKVTPINGSVADPFLHKIGLQTAEGRIKANMQAKFTQINEFLKLLVHTGELERLGAATHHPSLASSSSSDDNTTDSSSSSSGGSSVGGPVHILDAGCGSSHLTFGTFHYLHNVLELPVRLSGVDTNGALMQRSNRACQELGIADVAQFHTAAIREFPSLGLPSPDIVLALHACDTATDEALAVGVTSGTRVIMSVPCCQKDIQRQFTRQQQQQQRSGSSNDGSGDGQQVQQLFEPLLDHGILRQRQLDLLTDTFRAQLLRLAGYRTDVVEFVSTEHTPRNLLIRAVKRHKPLPVDEALQLARQYGQLRDAWGVRPQLERLLLDGFTSPIAEVLAR